MSFFQEMLEQIKAVWNGLPRSLRATYLIGVVLLVCVVTGVGIWSSQPQFMPLASGLSPAEAAEVVSQLDSNGIRHELNFSGSSVLVPKPDWNRARLVVDDIAAISSSSQFDDGMLGDPEMGRYKMQHRREESLARTIRGMNGVANATVHIAMAQRSPFHRETEETSASVVLQLRPAASFTREQAASIVALVAGSVEGLSPAGVSVMDTRGRMLSSQAGGFDAAVSSQLEYRRQLESDLAAKANVMLMRLLGEGRSMVKVSADLDFTSLHRTETKYDPDLKVRTQEEIRSFQRTAHGRTVGGVAGAQSNLGEVKSGFGALSPQTESEESNTTSYENGKTVDTVQEAPGKIKRLTIAAMVDVRSLTKPKNDAENDGAEPPSANAATDTPRLTKEDVAAIVKQAVGFDEMRGDVIEVLMTEFVGGPTADPFAVTNKWDLTERIVRNASLGLASVVALILGMMTLRKMRPVTVRVGGPDDSAERDELLSTLSTRLESNPDAMKAIVSAWLDDSDDDQQTSSSFPRAA